MTSPTQERELDAILLRLWNGDYEMSYDELVAESKMQLLAWRDQEVVKELKNLRDSEIANVSIRSLQVRINGRIKILTKNGGTDQ